MNEVKFSRLLRVRRPEQVHRKGAQGCCTSQTLLGWAQRGDILLTALFILNLKLLDSIVQKQQLFREHVASSSSVNASGAYG